MKKESIEEFLKRGGKIQKVNPGSASVMGSLQKSKKPDWTDEDVKKGKTGTAPRPDYNSYKPNTYHDYDVGGDKVPVYVPTKNDK